MTCQFMVAALLLSSLLAQTQGIPSARDTDCDAGNMTGAAPALVEKVDHFIRNLQSAVLHNDIVRVASMVNYPIVVPIGTELIRIDNKEKFVQGYDQIFTPHLKKVVMGQTAGCVNLMGEQGFMLASGEIWFNEYAGGRLLISTINPPIPGESRVAKP